MRVEARLVRPTAPGQCPGPNPNLLASRASELTDCRRRISNTTIPAATINQKLSMPRLVLAHGPRSSADAHDDADRRLAAYWALYPQP